MQENADTPRLATPWPGGEQGGQRAAGALLRIRLACAGVLLYVVYVLYGLCVRTTPLPPSVLPWVLSGPALLVVFGIGTYFASRISALLMLVSTVGPRAAAYWAIGGPMPSVPWMLLVAACGLAVFATFEYHWRR